jgi:hypothetical protein
VQVNCLSDRLAWLLVEGDSGKVTSQVCDLTTYTPALPCAFFAGRIDGIELSSELMSEEERNTRRIQAQQAAERGDDADQYWGDHPRQLHTVGYATTMLGAIDAGYAEGMLTGSFRTPHSWFQFDLGAERLGVVAPARQRVPDCMCGKHLGWADAAAPYRNVSRPDHWQKRGVLLSRN